MSENPRPPREWLEEHFVHDGTVTYCSMCQAIPFSFIGHACTSPLVMGHDCAEKVTVPYRWEDVAPVENSDHPGDWCLLYTALSMAAPSEAPGQKQNPQPGHVVVQRVESTGLDPKEEEDG